MIGTIRKHSTWLWVVIIGVVIITFVFWGSPSSKLNERGGRTANYGSINGQIVTPEDYISAQREVYLRYYITHKELPDESGKRSDFNAERETYFRLLLIQKQEDLGIHVGTEAVAAVAGNIMRAFNRGNPVAPQEFESKILKPKGFTMADLDRCLRHDLGIEQLVSVAAMSGSLVTPQEVRSLYERENEELSAQAVFFSATNYIGGIAVTPEALSQFYSNRMSTYRLPERVQVSYVKYMASNFLEEAKQELSQITNLNERVEAAYLQLGTNYFRDAKSPEEAKAKVREMWTKDLTLVRARKQANEFATELFKIDPMRAENLDKLAQQKGLVAQLSQPFGREEGPKDFVVGQDFAKAAFNLTAEEPFAGPFAGEDAAYVIALNGRLASEIPPLDAIRDQVTADYKFSQAVFQARKAGEEFHNAATNALAAGKSFVAICSETKVRPALPPPFSLSTRALPEVEDHVSLMQFKQAAFTTPLGALSVFTPTSDGGFVVFVLAKMPFDEARMKADLPNFTRAVRQSRQNEAFNDWFRQEAGRGLRDTPLGRAQQQQQQPGTARK